MLPNDPLAETTFKLSKQDRLIKPKHIKILFREGKSFKVSPLRVFYIKKSQATFSNNKVLFSISKKRIRSAVKRNRIKRLLREAYRINKWILNSPGLRDSGFVFLIGYVYNGNGEEIHHTVFNKAVIASLQHFRVLLNGKNFL
ncbi:ribonuclease P protein component [Cardinium endosymbiont of Tipula unca]|uniref:ribonuclease P protein component n=1 Tax=Cardinium endosymbiont of Tipula unca TaxID=3066216 RepID=UPI0030CFE802